MRGLVNNRDNGCFPMGNQGAILLVLCLSSGARAQTPTPTFVPPVGCCTAQATWSAGVSQPAAVKLDVNHVYVTEWVNNRVDIYNRGGVVPVATITTPGMLNPFGEALDGQGHLFVADHGAGKVWEFTVNGTLLTSFDGTGGSVPGNFNDLSCIWANNAGTSLIVTEGGGGGQRVRVFTPSGNSYAPVQQVTLPALPNPHNPIGVMGDEQGNLYVVDAWNICAFKYTHWNYTSGTVIDLSASIVQPREITWDWMGDFYVTDSSNNQFLEFNPDWSVNHACSTAVGGVSGGQPEGIVVDTDGHVYVADDFSNRVIVYSPCANFPLPVPTPTPTPSYTGLNPPGSGQCFVYPSPARGDHATLSYFMAESGQMDLKIWNENGELALETTDRKIPGAQVTPFSLSGFTRSVYFYTVTLRYDSGKSERPKPGKFAVIP
jgi:sugar lactone lactonase YvrE